jgi:hypothetical protein
MILMLVKHPRSSFFALNMDILAVYSGERGNNWELLLNRWRWRSRCRRPRLRINEGFGDALTGMAVLPGGVAEMHQARLQERERSVHSICNWRCAQTNCPSSIKHRLPLQVLALFSFLL